MKAMIGRMVGRSSESVFPRPAPVLTLVRFGVAGINRAA